MIVLLAILAGVLAVQTPVAPRDAEPATWKTFTGYWRIDPTIGDSGPDAPFRLHIEVEGDELTIERHGITMTEVARFKLDGTTAPTVQEGKPIEGSVALEEGGLVIRTRMKLPDGRVANVKELYLLQRRITELITIDRTTTIGTKTTTSKGLMRRLPPPRLLHPDNQP
jgi:hypothetical protein